jgi:predicted RNase H-like HicB family nuclease
MPFTAVYVKVPEGCIGFVKELPGANTQGGTLEETRINLREGRHRGRRSRESGSKR